MYLKLSIKEKKEKKPNIKKMLLVTKNNTLQEGSGDVVSKYIAVAVLVGKQQNDDNDDDILN
jgi:hypothetical protein